MKAVRESAKRATLKLPHKSIVSYTRRTGADIPLDPVAAYDRIAPMFPDLAESRRAYLDSIERLVIS